MGKSEAIRDFLRHIYNTKVCLSLDRVKLYEEEILEALKGNKGNEITLFRWKV